jgi:hypothetical protein
MYSTGLRCQHASHQDDDTELLDVDRVVCWSVLNLFISVNRRNTSLDLLDLLLTFTLMLYPRHTCAYSTTRPGQGKLQVQ